MLQHVLGRIRFISPIDPTCRNPRAKSGVARIRTRSVRQRDRYGNDNGWSDLDPWLVTQLKSLAVALILNCERCEHPLARRDLRPQRQRSALSACHGPRVSLMGLGEHASLN